MKIIRDPKKFQKEMARLRRRNLTLGFVPTMGALHEGHLVLVKKARKENKIVVVSIFVNPLQFGPREDFKRYPRNLKKDSLLLKSENVDYIFAPTVAALYPPEAQTHVEITQLAEGLCGKFRPGHFRGVATIVAKLFNVTLPHRAYFGAKDYQQAMVIKQMVHDLNFNLEVKVLPIVRDRNGLALSSRNAYLSASERERALAIPRALAWAKIAVHKKRLSPRALRLGILSRLRKNLDKIDYVELVEPKTLQPVKTLKNKFSVLIAGWVGKTRLIDNAIIPA